MLQILFGATSQNKNSSVPFQVSRSNGSGRLLTSFSRFAPKLIWWARWNFQHRPGSLKKPVSVHIYLLALVHSLPFSRILLCLLLSFSLPHSFNVLHLTSKLKISTISLYICLLFGPRSHGLVIRAVACEHEARGPGFDSSSDQMYFFSSGIRR